MQHTVGFDFSQFPDLKLAVIYGSGITNEPERRPFPPLPDFVFVVRGGQRELSLWHEENRRRNPSHYGRFSTLISAPTLRVPSTNYFFAPLARVTLSINGRPQRVLSKYTVISDEDWKSDLTNWHTMFVAGRLQKPTVLLNGKAGPVALLETAFPTVDLFNKDIVAPDLDLPLLQANMLQATRVSALLLPSRFNLLNLVRTLASLSYLGDRRNWVTSDLEKAKETATLNVLSRTHMLIPAMREMSSKWLLKIDEEDKEYLTGRYQPPAHRENANVGDDEAYIVSENQFSDRFHIDFENESDKRLITDIITSTRSDLVDEVRTQTQEKLLGNHMPTPLTGKLREATDLLLHKEIKICQSFSPEAQCSLFHQLPDTIQSYSIGVSAKDRLSNILSPFSLLDSERHRKILGGPLPFENVCIRKTLERVNNRTSRHVLLSSLLSAGILRSSLYGIQKLVPQLF